MAYEIERKFLVTDTTFESMATSSTRIVQAYLSDNPDCTVRVRIRASKAYITVKSRNVGAIRHEWEYEVPVAEAEEIARIAPAGHIDKTRYIVPYAGHDWEVDVFHGALTGLIVAEIELGDADEQFELPGFVGEEVTGDTRYYNSVLAQKK